jgi:hypothetical protein
LTTGLIIEHADQFRSLFSGDFGYFKKAPLSGIILKYFQTKKATEAAHHSTLHRSRAADWLEAVNQAVCRQFPQGIRETKHLELNLMQDNSSRADIADFYARMSCARHQAGVHRSRQSEGQC